MTSEELALKVGEMIYQDIKSRENDSLADKLDHFIFDALVKLSLAKTVVNETDPHELSLYEIEAITASVNEAYQILEKANKLFAEEDIPQKVAS